MRWGAWAIGLVAALTLVLAVVVTTSETTPLVDVGSRPTSTPTVTGEVQPSQPSTSASPPPSPRAVPRRMSTAASVVVYVVLVLFALFLLWLIVGAMRAEPRRTRDRVVEFTPSELDALDAASARRLAGVVKDQLSALQSGQPRNAVVACWLALEHAVAEVGVAAKAAETSAEFTQRILAAFELDDEAVHRLSELYREARFSNHPITERHRLAATAALERLRQQLDSTARRRSVEEAPA